MPTDSRPSVDDRGQSPADPTGDGHGRVPHGLAGLRLGPARRQVLLRAGQPDEAFVVAEGSSLAVGKSLRRAARDLERAGLVEVQVLRAAADGKRRQGVRLTVLGAAVVGQFRSELGGGGRIQWAKLNYTPPAEHPFAPQPDHRTLRRFAAGTKVTAQRTRG